jgi:hypothetical protein
MSSLKAESDNALIDLNFPVTQIRQEISVNEPFIFTINKAIADLFNASHQI